MSLHNMNSSNRNQIDFFSFCRSIKSQIFFLKTSLKMYLVQIFETVKLGVVIELISSNW